MNDEDDVFYGNGFVKSDVWEPPSFSDNVSMQDDLIDIFNS